MGPVVPCPLLVGRSAELELLSAAAAEARAGRGGVVFVVGEAGIGKSRLVQELAHVAQAQGSAVLRGRAVPGSSGAAFRPLAEAFSLAVPPSWQDADELAMWLPLLAGILPGAGPAGPAPDVAAPLRAEALLRLLRRTCGDAGGLLVLEDLHWGDPETVAVVEHFSDNLARVPVLCAVTVRSEEDGPAVALVRRAASRRSALVLELGRLNQAQVAAMVHSCTSGAEAAVVQRAVDVAGGVPFLVEEALLSPGLPASFAEAVRGRLLRLPETDRTLLLTAAVLGQHVDWHLLGAATGLAREQVVEGLERAATAQLLAAEGDTFVFRHALTAEAVMNAVSPPRREAAAAAALAALDASRDRVRGDWHDVAPVLAERAGQWERAGRLHLDAGERALARGALRTAVAALGRATALLPEGDQLDRAAERLVDALALAGRLDDALETARAVAARVPGERAAAVHLRVAGAATRAAGWDLAGAQLAAAEPLVRSSRSPRLAAELTLAKAELAQGTGDTDAAQTWAGEALTLGRQVSSAEIECAALEVLGRCARRSSLADAEAYFQQALATAQAHRLPLRRLRAMHELGTIALLDRCQVSALLEARALAESSGALATAAILEIEIAAGCHGRHDAEGQRQHGESAVRLGTALGLRLVEAYGWQHVAVAGVLSGDPEQVAVASAAARAAAPGNRDIEGLLVGACDVLAALLDDEGPAALAAAERAADLLRGSETAPPAHVRAAWPLLLAVAGRAEAPAALAELELAGVGVSRSGRGGLAMTRAVLRGRTDRAAAAALAVEADGDLAHVPLWQSLVRRLVAEAAATDGWRVPDAWLTDAELWLRRQCYERPAEACRALHGASTTPPRWTSLGVTPREADVLHLVIDGCSNRDIADRLGLSVRTVEKHLESLLRRTGARSRTQLARMTTTT